jgi:hypothetical protein
MASSSPVANLSKGLLMPNTMPHDQGSGKLVPGKGKILRRHRFRTPPPHLVTVADEFKYIINELVCINTLVVGNNTLVVGVTEECVASNEDHVGINWGSMLSRIGDGGSAGEPAEGIARSGSLHLPSSLISSGNWCQRTGFSGWEVTQMRVQRSIPTRDPELLDMSSTYYDAVKGSKLFDNTAAQVLVEALGDARTRFKVAFDEARFRDILKVAARNEIKKELVAALKRVIHYMEAMASDEDLKELQKVGVMLTKPKRKRKAKADQPELELAPAGA